MSFLFQPSGRKVLKGEVGVFSWLYARQQLHVMSGDGHSNFLWTGWHYWGEVFIKRISWVWYFALPGNLYPQIIAWRGYFIPWQERVYICRQNQFSTSTFLFRVSEIRRVHSLKFNYFHSFIPVRERKSCMTVVFACLCQQRG